MPCRIQSVPRQDIMPNIRMLYHEKFLFDVVLIAGIDHTRISAHGLVISALSEYVLQEFRKAVNITPEITLSDIDGPTLKLIVDFMYTGEIRLCSENVKKLLKAAVSFGIKLLAKICSDYLVERLAPSNCLGVALYAELDNHEELYEKATSFVFENYEEVCSGPEFLLLSEAQLTKYLSSDDIATVPQSKLFNSILMWVEHDKPGRKNLLLNLLSHIRYRYLSQDYIRKNKQHCPALLESWLEWHSLHDSGQLPATCESKLCFMTNQFYAAMEIQSFNPVTNRWSYMVRSATPTQRNNYGGTIINGGFVVLGGNTFAVERLDLQTMQWSVIPKVVIKLSKPALASLNNNLYTIGGRGIDRRWSDCVQKFDFSTSKWQELNPLPSVLIDITITPLNGFLYAVGRDELSFYCYNPIRDSWSRKPFKNEIAFDFGLVGMNRYLYAVGGLASGVESATVERFNPLDGTWTNVKPLNVARSHIKCAVLNNRLYAIGGRIKDKLQRFVEEYNPETDEWRILPPVLPYCRYKDYHFAFTI